MLKAYKCEAYLTDSQRDMAYQFFGIAHRQTCATDNQAYRSVVKSWGRTNVTDLSRVLTHMQSDNCKVGGGDE